MLRTELEPLLAKLRRCYNNPPPGVVGIELRVNPDGPEAATAIQSLLIRIEGLTEALEGLLEGLGQDGYVLPAGAIATAAARRALAENQALTQSQESNNG